MKIIVKRNEDSPEIIIDTKGLVWAWQFKSAFELALKQEGFIDEFIKDFFNETETENETED